MTDATGPRPGSNKEVTDEKVNLDNTIVTPTRSVNQLRMDSKVGRWLSWKNKMVTLLTMNQKMVTASEMVMEMVMVMEMGTVEMVEMVKLQLERRETEYSRKKGQPKF